ncbi:polysaccharide deacetylase family protein [Paraburkholderia elongata]|uniref:polysaccharide deacetylase family protein n=1 Tax=Paraburkholderia elongata TaxID=2675747 RepID=UPI00155600AF|nr:polysaccharide deacetylase family protein [Paraburkholderia elongata]
MKKITLTFDNGPTPGVTDKVLDILARRSLDATFMVVGQNLFDPSAAALLDDVAAAGHWIGNHSLTHTVAFGERRDAEYVEHEIGETQRLLGCHAHSRRFFRPFGNNGLLGPHLLCEAALTYLLRNRYTSVLWNSVPHDWDDQATWVERCLADVARQNWTVAVLHDIANASLARLPELLDRLVDAGVEFTQEFPEEVILTRDGEPVSLWDTLVAERNLPAAN